MCTLYIIDDSLSTVFDKKNIYFFAKKENPDKKSRLQFENLIETMPSIPTIILSLFYENSKQKELRDYLIALYHFL